MFTSNRALAQILCQVEWCPTPFNPFPVSPGWVIRLTWAHRRIQQRAEWWHFMVLLSVAFRTAEEEDWRLDRGLMEKTHLRLSKKIIAIKKKKKNTPLTPFHVPRNKMIGGFTYKSCHLCRCPPHWVGGVRVGSGLKHHPHKVFLSCKTNQPERSALLLREVIIGVLFVGRWRCRQFERCAVRSATGHYLTLFSNCGAAKTKLL